MNKEDTKQQEKRELKPEVLRIAGVLKDELKLDTSTGEFNQVGEDSLYEKCLPENLSIKTVKEVHGHDRAFTAAVAKVVGDASLQAFIDNKDLKETTAKVPTDGRSSLTIKVNRKKEYLDRISGNNGDDEAPSVEKYCSISAKMKVSFGTDFNTVKSDLLEKGKAALAK